MNEKEARCTRLVDEIGASARDFGKKITLSEPEYASLMLLAEVGAAYVGAKYTNTQPQQAEMIVNEQREEHWQVACAVWWSLSESDRHEEAK